MGLYTNRTFGAYIPSSDYTDVEPFKGEHFNYHELGIIAATESAANRDAFMKAIALNELASVEQYGTEEVFYEAVNIKGIFERIKAFFKKIIEKIHKIFHTFIAKLGSWFQSSNTFAKKYEKEIIKNWGQVKNDWEFKGYKFSDTLTKNMTKEAAKSFETKITASKNNDPVVELLKKSDNAEAFGTALANMANISDIIVPNSSNGITIFIKNDERVVDEKGSNWEAIRFDDESACDSIRKQLHSPHPIKGTVYKYDKSNFLNTFSDGSIISDTSGLKSTSTVAKAWEILATKMGASGSSPNMDKKVFSKFREDFNEKGKDQIRHKLVEDVKNGDFIVSTIDIDFNHNGSLDANEFTEELHKAIYGEDDKEDLSKSAIETIYGGSITAMITFLKDYNKIKSSIEKSERDIIKSIDNKVKAIDEAQNKILKDKNDKNKKINEDIIQLSAVFQSFWGFIKECETQAFAVYLSGVKDACSQAKQIAVKIIGLGKKMTEESVDYSNYYNNDGNFNSFIENVKLV